MVTVTTPGYQMQDSMVAIGSLQPFVGRNIAIHTNPCERARYARLIHQWRRYGMTERKRTAPVRQSRVTYDTVCELAQRLPEVEESTSYGTPALKVRGKMFVRLKEDGDTIVLRSDSFEREHLLASAPQTFFITDHYRDYPWVLVRLSTVDAAQLGELLEDAWRRVAPRKLIAARDTPQ